MRIRAGVGHARRETSRRLVRRLPPCRSLGWKRMRGVLPDHANQLDRPSHLFARRQFVVGQAVLAG